MQARPQINASPQSIFPVCRLDCVGFDTIIATIPAYAGGAPCQPLSRQRRRVWRLCGCRRTRAADHSGPSRRRRGLEVPHVGQEQPRRFDSVVPLALGLSDTNICRRPEQSTSQPSSQSSNRYSNRSFKRLLKPSILQHFTLVCVRCGSMCFLNVVVVVVLTC